MQCKDWSHVGTYHNRDQKNRMVQDGVVSKLSRSISNHDDDGKKQRDKFAYLTIKNNSFARFARALIIFGHFADIPVSSTT